MPLARADPASAPYAQAHAWATHWSQRWFLDPDGEDRLRLGDIHAGWETHVEAFLTLLDLASERLGAPLSRRPSARRWLKGRGYDRLLRATALRRLAPVQAIRRRIAVIVEIPTPSMSEPAAAVAAAAGVDASIAIADPRAARMVQGAGHRPTALVLPWGEERTIARAAATQLAEAWSDLAARPPPIQLDDRDVSDAVLARLRPLVLRSMPYLAVEAVAIGQYLDAVRPDGVAIASDQHRIGRLTVAAARQRGIRSIVLQHGLPQSTVGYLPVVADAVATWSPASASWFVAHGTDPTRIAVTGNPRLDRRTSTFNGDRGAVHVLLALSPTAVATNAALVHAVVAATIALQGARLTIKLHPGQSDWSFVDPIVHGAGIGDRVVVRRHEPLEPLLRTASVVVVHRSTVAVEALVAGRPVVVHRVGDEPTTADLELASLALPVTDDVPALTTVLSELSNRTAADAYLADRRPAIEWVAGPMDGRSAQRIVEMLRRPHVDADQPIAAAQ